jgi:hypothetical protein
MQLARCVAHNLMCLFCSKQHDSAPSGAPGLTLLARCPAMGVCNGLQLRICTALHYPVELYVMPSADCGQLCDVCFAYGFQIYRTSYVIPGLVWACIALSVLFVSAMYAC